VRVEVLGEPDEAGRLRARVETAPGLGCELLYLRWAGNLMVFEADEAADPVQIGLSVLALHALAEQDGPTRLVHYAIHHLATLRVYRDSALGVGVALSGIFGDRGLSYDPLGCVDLDVEPEPASELHRAVDAIVTYSPTLHRWGSVEVPSEVELVDWLHDPDELHRACLVRRLGQDARLPEALARWAHLVAMLNESYTVRQFAAMQLSGFSPGVRLEAELASLHQHLVDPGEVVRGLLGPEHPWTSAQARRNARYAVLWTLGNIAWTATGATAAAWLTRVVAQTRRLLEEQAAAHSLARDRWLLDRVRDEFIDRDETRFAVGVQAELSLFDLLRFVTLRARVVHALGLIGTDRFYWLSQSAEAISGAEGALAERLAAPSPDGELPAGVTQMPPWSYGENHLSGGPG
jgi:hypothetical protein